MSSVWNQVNQHIGEVIKQYKNIAVVGLSPKPFKASHGVAFYLQQVGYNIIPVNPNYDEILGQVCYPSLKEAPDTIEVVDIFRRAEDVPPIVEEAIAIGAKAVGLQSGIINEQAAQNALDAGLKVMMDVCMKVEHMRHAF
jgi:predicted CoA-binding protein